MDAVSIYDHMLTAIRERQLTHDEVNELLNELWLAYPESVEQAGLSGNFEPDWKNYDETLPDRDATEKRPY